MKLLTSVALLAGLVAGLPNRIEEIRSLGLLEEYSKAQSIHARASSETRNELQAGGTCPPVIFIYARGSTEGGNLVRCKSSEPNSLILSANARLLA